MQDHAQREKYNGSVVCVCVCVSVYVYLCMRVCGFGIK